MAHIPDGVLSAPVLMGGGAVAAALLTYSVRRLKEAQIPQAAVLSSAFFVASLVHIPVGPTSVHPLLTGLLGVVLGWAAVPAVLVALLLQAVLFGFGGVTVLGVNVVNMAVPALVVAALFTPSIRSKTRPRSLFLLGLAAGITGVGLVAIAVSTALALSSEAYVPALAVVFLSYGPLAIVEGVVTGAAVVLMRRVKPELLASGVAISG